MLAIVTTHPIQYYAPVFRLLHQRNNVPIKVFYTWGTGSFDHYDPGFERPVTWDIPLLEGYPYEFAENTASDPGSHHYKGIINPGLIAAILRSKPDAILVFGWAYDSHLKVLRYFKNKIPVYFRGDSTLLDDQPGVRSVFRSLFLRWVYSHVDHAFYPGTRTQAYFERFGLKPHQLSFAPHAIDNDRFSEQQVTRASALRDQLNIKPNSILILFAGKFEEKKSPLLLLEAFKRLDNNNCDLLFTGNGPLQEILQQKAGGSNRIHFLNFQNQTDMPVLYQTCDLFCLPSKGPGETWGLAVNEAMASGKAVLVSDKTGCAIDLVKSGFNGMVFESNNVTELTKALNLLTSSKDNLKKYGENAKVLIKDWCFKNIAAVFEEIIASKQI